MSYTTWRWAFLSGDLYCDPVVQSASDFMATLCGYDLEVVVAFKRECTSVRDVHANRDSSMCLVYFVVNKSITWKWREKKFSIGICWLSCRHTKKKRVDQALRGRKQTQHVINWLHISKEILNEHLRSHVHSWTRVLVTCVMLRQTSLWRWRQSSFFLGSPPAAYHP